MDIKVFREEGQIEIVIRNYDEPYNPLVFESENDSFSKIGITLVQKISKNISYNYVYHMNVISMVLDAKDNDVFASHH